MMELCTFDTCKPEVRINLNTYKEVLDNASESIRTHSPDFVTKTADQMSLSEEELAIVFPERDCFFDVVHLSPLGHAVVAKQLGAGIETNEVNGIFAIVSPKRRGQDFPSTIPSRLWIQLWTTFYLLLTHRHIDENVLGNTSFE